jgi:hypothetical protein
MTAESDQISNKQTEDCFENEFQEMWEETQRKCSNRKMLSQLSRIDSRESLEKMIESIKQGHAKHQDARKGSTTKARGAHVQKICAGLSRFLESYAGVFEVVRGLDSRAGAIGYGVLSVLLTASISTYPDTLFRFADKCRWPRTRMTENN